MIEPNEDIIRAVECLEKGGIIVYPTDTIWGLGCDATNDKAVDRIYKMKRRARTKSMIVLLHDRNQLENFVTHVPEIAYSLMEQIQTPLTIIYPQAKNLAKNVCATDGSVAIRIVKDPFCRLLCQTFGKPIVSTSANISGDNYPMVFREIDKSLLEKADYVMTTGRSVIRLVKPSTKIKLLNNWEYEIIRT